MTAVARGIGLSRLFIGLLSAALLVACGPGLVETSDPWVCRELLPAGGRIEFPFAALAQAPAVLTLPAGAVEKTVQVCAAASPSLAVGSMTPLGPAIDLQPQGLRFAKPVRLYLQYDPNLVPAAGAALAVAQSPASANGEAPGDVLGLDPSTRLAQTEVSELATFQIVYTPPETGDAMTRQLDILFMIDNSPSMLPKQKALAANIPRFMALLADTVADGSPNAMNRVDYQIGIITSDIGSTVAPNTPWQTSIGACDKYAGDDGKLQNLPCTKRGLTGDAKAACESLCPDDKYVPRDPGTGNPQFFIHSDNMGHTNVPAFIDPMTMKDIGPAKAFQCMAVLGDKGCAIEGQLEAVKRALDGHNLENKGFLRANSLVAVILVTDEDDCSVQMARRAENDPATRDCMAGDESPECFNYDFRCLAASVKCMTSLSTPGSKTGCVERPGNYLESVQSRYVQFIKGLRMNANQRLISGIWTMSPVDKGGKLAVSAMGGGSTTPFLDRAPGMNASCVDASDPKVFGAAQRRLSEFACSLPGSYQQSICESNGWELALYNIYQAIVKKAHGSLPPLVACPP